MKAVCLHRGATTDITARFPTMGGRFAAAGAERDVCGFALEF
jgi:catalase